MQFLARYGARAGHIAPLLRRFDAEALRRWVHDLGIETFVGSSGRVFPTDMKAAPMLRAWLHRLREVGRAVPYAASLDRLGGRGIDDARLRHAGRRSAGSRRCRRARARRRELAAAGLGRRVGAASRSARRARAAVRAVELRLRRRLERALQQPLRGRAAQIGGDRAAARRRRASTGASASASSPRRASKAVWSTRCRRRSAIANQSDGAGTTILLDLAPRSFAGTRARRSAASARRAVDVESSAKPPASSRA